MTEPQPTPLPNQTQPVLPELAERGSTGPPAPDWSRIPFNIPCGRCGGTLNGVVDSTCPHCGLDLDWVEVVPVDRLRCPTCHYSLLGLTAMRCPECGQPFTAVDVLAMARSRSSDLFENQWREKPLSALVRTWRLAALRPAFLWSCYSLHDAPRIGPLLLFALSQAVVFAVGWHCLAFLADWTMKGLVALLDSQYIFFYNYRPRRNFMPLVGFWYLFTFACFQIFVQSKYLFRVKWQHILRVYVHCTPIAAGVMAWWLMAEWVIDLGLLLVPPLRPHIVGQTYVMAGYGIFTMGVVSTAAYVWIGYRSYLRVPRGWGHAAMSMGLGYVLARMAVLYV